MPNRLSACHRCQVHASNALTLTEVEVDVQADNHAAAAAPPTTIPTAAAAAVLPEFVPTNEWQTVLPGQSIPPGLWVRVDMSTGVKTARLLPEEEQNDLARRRAAAAASRASSASNELALVPEDEAEGKAGSADGPVIRELPLPGEGGAGIVSVSGDATPASEAALQRARAARIALLKENFYLKEDVEQMKQLLGICVDPASSVGDVTRALELLEEFLHQIDNANDWVKIGGLDVSLTLLQQNHETTQEPQLVQTPSSTSDVPDDAQKQQQQQQSNDTAALVPPAPADLQLQRLYALQSHASWVLGTAAQNNRQVQEAARKEGAIPILVQLYQRTLAEEAAAETAASAADVAAAAASAAATAEGADSASVSAFQLRSARLKLLSKTLYALSALLRNNAPNQAVFRATGGAPALKQDLPENWSRCADTAAAAALAASSLGCVSPVEESSLRKLRATHALKALNLLHDFVSDHTVNARELRSPATGELRPANPDMSDAELFAQLVSPEWCAHYVQRAEQAHPLAGAIDADGLLVPLVGGQSALHTREQALEILTALLEHDDGVCLPWMQSGDSGALASLQAVAAQHADWAVRAGRAALAEQGADADIDDVDGLARYHADLRDMAVKITQRIAG